MNKSILNSADSSVISGHHYCMDYFEFERLYGLHRAAGRFEAVVYLLEQFFMMSPLFKGRLLGVYIENMNKYGDIGQPCLMPVRC